MVSEPCGAEMVVVVTVDLGSSPGVRCLSGYEEDYWWKLGAQRLALAVEVDHGLLDRSGSMAGSRGGLE